MVLAVGILPIGQVDATILFRVKEGLVRVFPETTCSIVDEQLPLSENILKFKTRYKNVYTHYLPVHYRSTDGIINLSKELIVKNKRRLKKDIKS